MQGEDEKAKKPPTLEEALDDVQLLDPTSAEAQQLAAYLERIANRLLDAEGVPTADRPFRYLIEKSESANAFIVPHASPPPIVLSLGLLRMFKNEDELAAVLRHEIEHYNLRRQQNSKAQELACDLASVTSLRLAGYNPEATAHLLRRFPKGWERSLSGYFDPHPGDDMRVRDVESFAAIKARKEGDAETALTPLDSTMTAFLPPPLQKDLQPVEAWLAQRKFEAQDYTGRYKLLDEYFVTVALKQETWGQEDQTAFAELFKKHQPDKRNAAQFDAYCQLIDHILLSPQHHIYTKVAGVISVVGSEKIYQALGPLLVLNRDMHNFLSASTAADAELHAEKIIEKAERYRRILTGEQNRIHVYFSTVENAERDYKRTMGVHSAWDKHCDWIKEGKAPRSHVALAYIGVGQDRRLPELTDTSPMPYEIYKLSDEASKIMGNNLTALMARFSDRSHLAGRKTSSFNRTLAEERRRDAIELRRIQTKDEVETRLLAATDWSQLEEDFTGFVDKHQAFLLPEVTTVSSGGAVFAAAFATRVRALLRKDPPKFFPLVSGFLFGHDYRTNDSLIGRLEIQLLNDIGNKNEDWYSPRMGVQINHPLVELIFNYENELYDVYPGGHDDLPIYQFEHYGAFRQAAGVKRWLLNKTAYRNVTDLSLPLNEQFALSPRLIFPNWSDQPTWDNFLRQSANADRFGFTDEVLHSLLHKTLEANPRAVVVPDAMIKLLAYAKTVDPLTAPLVHAQIERNFAHSTRAEADVWELAETYVIYSTNSSFVNDDALRVRYERALMEKAATLTSPEEKERLARTLLCRQTYGYPRGLEFATAGMIDLPGDAPGIYSGRLASHKFRSWAQSLMVEGVAARLGPDDGSDAYYESMTQALQQFRNAMQKTTNLFELLPALAEAVVAQPNTAFYMRDLRTTQLEKLASISTYVGAPVELTLDEIGKSEWMRLAAIDFLTSPLSKESAFNFGAVGFRQIANRLKQDMNGELFDDYPSDEKIIEHFSRVHREFWAAPMEARAWYLDKVLFPPSQNGDAEFDQAAALVLGKAFGDDARPAGSARIARTLNVQRNSAAQDRRYSQQRHRYNQVEADIITLRNKYPQKIDAGSQTEKAYEGRRSKLVAELKELAAVGKSSTVAAFKEVANVICAVVAPYLPSWRRISPEHKIMRQIGETYLDTIPRNEKRLALSALMAARSMAYDEQSDRQDVSPGKFAAQVLYYMDELGGKILQAIDSHPGVSEDFKKHMGDAKANYQKPLRWDALQWAIDHGIHTDNANDNIVHYGAVIGSGSMGYTLQVHTRDGHVYADTILRPHARARTEREARNVVTTAQKLARANKKLAAAPDIAAVAQRDARIETQMSLAYKQGLVATQIYDGLETTATVNGKTYSFTHHAAETTVYSAGGKRSELVHGTHFNDLPETTADERDYKIALAIQLYGTELFNILSGKPCDRDRHGKNQKIERGRINHFDFGMTALTLPSEAQKRAMVRIATAVLRDNLLFKKDMATAFDEQLRKLKATEDVKQFMSGFRRQILSLGDFEKYLSTDERQEIAAAIVQSGRVDPVIGDELRSTAVGRKVWETLATAKTSIFAFDDRGCETNLRMPTLAPFELHLLAGQAVQEPTTAKPAILPSAQPATHDDRDGTQARFAADMRHSATALCRWGRQAATRAVSTGAGPNAPSTPASGPTHFVLATLAR